MYSLIRLSVFDRMLSVFELDLLGLMALICSFYLILNMCPVWPIYFYMQSPHVGVSCYFDKGLLGDWIFLMLLGLFIIVLMVVKAVLRVVSLNILL